MGDGLRLFYFQGRVRVKAVSTHVMKDREVEVPLRSFLASVLDGGKRSDSRPSRYGDEEPTVTIQQGVRQASQPVWTNGEE